jgi:hypothetical protein
VIEIPEGRERVAYLGPVGKDSWCQKPTLMTVYSTFATKIALRTTSLMSRRAMTPPGGHTVPKEQGTKRFVPALAAALTGYC